MASQHTRLPLWRGEPENIIGVLHTKQFVQALLENKGDIASVDVVGLAAAPWFVPDTTTLEEQLEAFRERRSHFALVVDEYGALRGLVTLEDILSEIIGEVPEDIDGDGRPDVRKRPDGSYLVVGKVAVRDLNRELDWNLPDDGATTIAGLVIQEAGTIPEAGQRFSFFGFKFEVLRRQRNQITALKVIPPAKAEMPPG
jgi:Mg2+/Co2+ transporter CorB